MVMKICKVCGKEFDARGNAKCCSPECSKIRRYKSNNKYRQSDKGKAAVKRYKQSDKGKAADKRYRQSDKGKATRKKNNRKYEQSERCKEYRKKYRQSERGKEYHKRYNREYEKTERCKEYRKKYYKNNRDERLKYQKEYNQNKIAELNEKYDGDLELILKDCPNSWLVREAIMQVDYGVSYAEAMYQKFELNPVCEITGESNDLVIHHLDSFNLHPEKGADLDNLVVVTKEIHNEFHSIYGYGNNTREQWFEFLNKKQNLYI